MKVGKDECGRRPIGYTGKHSTHLELSCEVLDAISRDTTCQCGWFVAGKITESGHAKRYVDIALSSQSNSVELTINDRRRQFYYALPVDNTVEVVQLLGQIEEFLARYCKRHSLQFRVGGAVRGNEESAVAELPAANGLAAFSHDELRRLCEELETALQEAELLRTERGQLEQQLQHEQGERVASEQLLKEAIQNLSERIQRLTIDGSSLPCIHLQIIDRLLSYVRQGETTAEILELVDLLSVIRHENEEKAINSFQALKVHLDSCDHQSEELKIARTELERRTLRIAELEQDVHRLAKTGQTQSTFQPTFDFFLEKYDQYQREIGEVSVHEEEAVAAEQEAAQIQCQLQGLREACAPQLEAISKAAAASNLEELTAAYVAFGEHKGELQLLEQDWKRLVERAVEVKRQCAVSQELFKTSRQYSQMAKQNLEIIQPVRHLLQEIEQSGGHEAYWRLAVSTVDLSVSDAVVVSPAREVQSVVRNEPPPVSKKQQAVSNKAECWSSELLQLADGLPLPLLFTQNAFLGILGNGGGKADRRKRYQQFVDAGIDISWLLTRMQPGTKFKKDEVFSELFHFLESKQLAGEKHHMGRSWISVVEGLLGNMIIDKKNLVDGKAKGSLMAMLKKREADYRRWTTVEK